MLISALLLSCLSLPGCGGGGGDDTAIGSASATSLSSGTTDSASAPTQAAADVPLDLALASEPASNVPELAPAADASAAPPVQASPEPATDASSPAGTVAISQVGGRGRAATATVASSDIIAELSASKAIADETWYGVNCYGQMGPLRNFPNGEIYGPRLPDGSTLRMGKAPDPLNTSRNVYMVKVGQNDVLTAGGKRCELIAYGDDVTHLPMAQNIWFGVNVLVNQGQNMQGQDDQIIMQWHTYGFNPFFAVLLKDGKLRAQIRYNTLPNGTMDNSVLKTVWNDSAPVQRRWMTFVVNARLSPFASDAPFLKIWRDGTQIVNYSGPISYNSSEYSSARVGLYHWVNSGNTWDPNSPVRSLMFTKSFFAKDPKVQYTEPVVRSYTLGN